MEYEILTGILKRFTIYLEDLPANLRLISHTLLFFLATIDIALTVYTNMDNENFSYYKWIKNKILKLGFILFAINQYEWLLAGIKDFFFDVAGKAIRTNLFSNNEYFENPSELYSKGADLAAYIYKEGVSWYSPKSWIYIILSILIIIGFLMLAVQLIICWIEYYFLTGISIIFLPFGVLDVGLDFYKNVFKTIMSCSIKLAVMNFWLRLSTVILNDLFKLTNNNVKMELVILIFGTLYVIVAIMQFMPSMTSGLLTGTPAVNASAAMAGATGAIKGLGKGIADAYRGGKEVVKEAWKGGQTGANVGGTAGGAVLGFLAGPVGGAVGKIVGGTLGAVGGAAVGGSYAGARYAIFKEKAKDKVDNSNSNNTSSSGSGGGRSSSSNSGNTGGSSESASNQQNTSSNGSGSGGTTVSSGQSATSSNVQNSTGSGSVNSNTQNASNDTQTTSNSSVNSASAQTSGSATNADNRTNTSTTQSTDNTQSTGSDTSANTNSVSADTGVTSNATSQDTRNNVDSSNNDENSTANASSTNSTSTETGDSSVKRGVKINGGEAGKIPEWMKDDY